MSHQPVPTPPQRPRAALRRDAPVWRQAIEGIGLVVVLSAVVVVVGLLIAFLVSLLF